MSKNYWRMYGPGKQSKDFVEGVKAGFKAYAWWKDGIEYVGDGHISLKDAINEVEEELGGKDGKDI